MASSLHMTRDDASGARKKQKSLARLTVEDLAARGQLTAQRVLMRVDFNVPMTKGTTTISNPQHQKVAGCTQLDIPSGELIRENTTGEPFEVIKLLHDSVLPHAHVYWHSGGWRAVSRCSTVAGAVPPSAASRGLGMASRELQSVLLSISAAEAASS